MHTEYRWLLPARRHRPGCPGHRGHRSRVAASAPAPRRGRWRVMWNAAGTTPGWATTWPCRLGIRREFDADFAFQFGIPKPNIAAVNRPRPGPTAARLLLACTRGRGAKLTTSHGRLGLPAEYGLSWLLPRLIGVTRAATCCCRAGSCWPRRRNGSVWSTVCWRRTSCWVPLRLRRAARHGDRSVLAGRDEAPALPRPARRRRLVGARRRARMAAMMGGAGFAEGVAALTEKRPPAFPDTPA